MTDMTGNPPPSVADELCLTTCDPDCELGPRHCKWAHEHSNQRGWHTHSPWLSRTPGHVLVFREDLRAFFAALGHTRTFRQNTAPGEAEERLRAAAESTP